MAKIIIMRILAEYLTISNKIGHLLWILENCFFQKKPILPDTKKILA